MLMYSLKQLENVLNKDLFWLLRQCEDDNGRKLKFDDTHIDESSYIIFIKWYNNNFTDAIELPKTQKRKYSTSHRIEIAYKCKYRCNMCGDILKPDFHVDHIIELRDGGLDEYDNLQTLCVACHSEKTRVNTLKNHTIFRKEFSQRAKEIEDNAFKKFQHVRKSKYF